MWILGCKLRLQTAKTITSQVALLRAGTLAPVGHSGIKLDENMPTAPEAQL